jgi:type IV secretory pathway TrbD component
MVGANLSFIDLTSWKNYPGNIERVVVSVKRIDLVLAFYQDHVTKAIGFPRNHVLLSGKQVQILFFFQRHWLTAGKIIFLVATILPDLTKKT